jgi:hypothetical protein
MHCVINQRRLQTENKDTIQILCASDLPARNILEMLSKSAEGRQNVCMAISAAIRIGGKQWREFGWVLRSDFGCRALNRTS